ncbi:hypothetical protein [Actinoallomurus acaciae]|uniref:Short subunit dehydrogenase n=1 Tax=Actinoallomurus acaciae TaxID=502577 RepID=A0ABV5YDW3_9ACTN
MFFLTARGAGVIINTGFAGSALYSATKAAIESFTLSWATEFGPPAVYMASDDAAYVHGASFTLDGWTTARR